MNNPNSNDLFSFRDNNFRSNTRPALAARASTTTNTLDPRSGVREKPFEIHKPFEKLFEKLFEKPFEPEKPFEKPFGKLPVAFTYPAQRSAGTRRNKEKQAGNQAALH